MLDIISKILLNGLTISTQEILGTKLNSNDTAILENIMVNQEYKALHNALIKCSKLYKLIPGFKLPNNIDVFTFMEYLEPKEQEIFLFNIDLLKEFERFENVLETIEWMEKKSTNTNTKNIENTLIVTKNIENTLIVSNKFMKEFKKSL